MTGPSTVARGEGTLLLLACPIADLEAAVAVDAAYGMVLLPAGGVGDLAACSPTTTVYLVAVDDSGAQPAATWRAQLVSSLSLVDPDPSTLVPATWHARHQGAYAQVRLGTSTPPEVDDPLDDDEDEADVMQMFLPVAKLSRIPQTEWLFTNELVPKQARRGRRFAPRVPTLVTMPD